MSGKILGSIYFNLLVSIAIFAGATPILAVEQVKDLTEMSIEDLMNIEVASTATLTDTKPRLVPAAVTVITAEEVQASGARSLNELLVIYVPNLQWKYNMWEPSNLGLRGIINDRDDKYLLLVNGRKLNDHTHYGAVTERDLPVLNDIHHVDVVRGPGSALYGPGAVSMVINIVTYNAQTFQGTEITGRLGAIEEFYTAELKHGRAFDDNDGGIFLYGGIGKYNGADKHDSPQIYGFDFPEGAQMGWDNYTTPSDGTRQGHPLLHPSINNDGEAYKNLPPFKLHAQLKRGNWDIWARYIRGGQQFGWDPGVVTRAPYGWYNWLFLDWVHGNPAYITPKPNQFGYQQMTGFIGYEQQLNDNMDIDYAFSYSMLDYIRIINGNGTISESYREDNYYGRILLKWQPCENHRFAIGPEISYNQLGLQSPSLNEDNPFTAILGDMKPWSTTMYSLVGEWQWTINEQLTAFAGARVDDHTYTEQMFSPRLAGVYTPNEKDTYKVMWSRSVRMSYEEAMRANSLDPDSDSQITPPEKLDSIEFRYERQHNKNLDFAASVFWHYNFEVISYSGGSDAVIGNQKEWGFELEAAYHTDKTRLSISHAYTKLIDFDLEEGMSTFITAHPYGYGKDLAMWSNHITKLQAQQKLDDKWTLDGSLRIYWGFPGMKDLDEYNHDIAVDGTAFLYDTSWNKTYEGNYYLNLGLRYQPCKDLTIGLYGYYLLGIFDKDLNKRNTGYQGFRDHAPAVSVSVAYRF